MEARLAAWLSRTFGEATEAQARTIPLVEARQNVLLSSPTGSGKTLAAFLGILSDLASAPLQDRTYCLYVSPLKALVNDMALNLAAPIEGAALPIRVATRTGDTPPHERAKQLRSPPHILITTPESLALLLASPKARAHLLGVRYVVVDEIHSLAESKRGAQLMLALERLAAYVGEFQRIGLSATVRPLDAVSAFLAGDRVVHLVEVQPRGIPELDVAMPVPDPLSLTSAQLDEHVLDLVEVEMARSRTLLVFTNTRAAAERLARQLKARHSPEEIEEVASEVTVPDVELVLPHHGSMSKAARLGVEDRLKTGRVRCVVASSSLELGIHVDHVDRVLLLGSPKSAARTLQRIGRSGHVPGRTARATLVVTDPCDLLEAHALQRLARERRVENVRFPRAPLDVLVQHLVALRLELPLARDEAFVLTRRARSYHDLAREAFDAVWEEMPRMPRHEYLQNAGTIPESGLLKVFHAETYVGEVEEDFAASLSEDDVFLLAGRVWRFLRATPARVVVQPARSTRGAVPVWRGEGLGASQLLADETKAVLSQRSLDHPWTLSQERWTGPVAEDALVESFPNEQHRAVVFHAHLGRRGNDALARALAWRTGHRALASDWGFALLAPRAWKPARAALLRVLAEPIEPTLREALWESELLKRRFRHVAQRALVIRRREGEGLGMRQQAANRLLSWLPEGHPLIREAFEECLHDAMDVEAAEEWRLNVVADDRPLRLVDHHPCASMLAARILAPPGEARHHALREHADAMRMYAELSR